MQTQVERQECIRRIRDLPTELAALVHNLSPEQLTTAYIKGEWTVAQNVHHLADSHMNSYIRCKLIATEDEPMLKAYDQDRWATFPDAAGADLADSLGLLAALHGRWALFWERLPDEAWSRSGRHPEEGIVTLEDLARRYASHGQAHLDQIARTLAAQPAEQLA